VSVNGSLNFRHRRLQSDHVLKTIAKTEIVIVEGMLSDGTVTVTATATEIELAKGTVTVIVIVIVKETESGIVIATALVKGTVIGIVSVSVIEIAVEILETPGSSPMTSTTVGLLTVIGTAEIGIAMIAILVETGQRHKTADLPPTLDDKCRTELISNTCIHHIKVHFTSFMTTNNKLGAIEGIRPFMISSTNSHVSAADQQAGLLPTEDGHHT
jgi:hypothetical protein